MDKLSILNNISAQIKKEVLKPHMDRLPLAYLMTLRIPDSVKHFFDQEVEKWIWEEQDKIFVSERFDYEMPEVRMLLDKVFDILKSTATFSIPQFERLLERALKLEVNYTISPHRTLRQFLFKDKPIISTIEVYDLLKYFSKYSYYKDALTKYFNLKYMKEVSEPQFSELIAQIDNQVFTKDPIQSIVKIMKTALNFINQGREESDVLDTEIVLELFTDRDLTTHSKIIEVLISKGFNQISLAQLEHILSTGQMPERAPEQNIEPESSTIEEDIVEQISTEANEDNTASADMKDMLKEKLKSKLLLEKADDIEEEKPPIEVESISIPEKTEEVVEEDEVEEEVEDEVEEETEDEYVEDEEYEDDDDEYEDEGGEEETDGTPENLLANLVSKRLGDSTKGLPALEAIISPKTQKRFIKKLFKKQNKKYSRMIKNLNDTASWKQASLIIDNKFYEMGINPYSKEAIEFSDLVYNRYFPKEKNSTVKDVSA